MTILDSRVRNGVLTIDASPFSAQATDVALTPSTKEVGDRVEVLSGEVIAPEDETTWALEFSGIQDFDDAAGWIEFARASAGETVAFSFQPNDEDEGVTYAGTCKVRPVKIGGPVNKRNQSVASWPVVTGPTPTYEPPA